MLWLKVIVPKHSNLIKSLVISFVGLLTSK